MPQSTTSHPKRFRFFSKLPFFRKSKKSNKLQTRPLKVTEILRFADKLDVLLMIIGTIAGRFYLTFHHFSFYHFIFLFSNNHWWYVLF